MTSSKPGGRSVDFNDPPGPASKGFGFLKPDAAGLPDCFFHISQVAEVSQVDLQPGTRVEFEPSKGPDGRDRAV